MTYAEFLRAWAPPGLEGPYPATVTVSRDLADERRVLTVLEMDVTPQDFDAISPRLTRPDARERLAEIVESTHLQGLYEQVFDEHDLP